MNARDIMTHPVITVTPDTEIQDIVRLLFEARISGVPVVDEEQNLVGLVSEGDLVRHAGTGVEEEGQPASWLAFLASPAEKATSYVKRHGRFAREVMTRKVHTVSEETSLPAIAKILEGRAIKRVPVVRQGKVVGIVSRANLLQGLAAAKPHVARSVADSELRRALTEAVAEAGIRTTFLNIVVSDGVAHLWGAVESREERDALKVVIENASDLKGVENHVNVMPNQAMRSMGAV